MFVYIQRCHSDCWLDKLSISFDNYLAEDKYLYYGSAVIKPCFYRFVVLNFIILHVNVGVHIGHTAMANFYIGPVKKPMQLVMRREMLIY